MQENKNIDRLFWEKYRPQTLDEVVLPERVKTVIQHGIKTNLIFVGPPGIGKTTVAKILVKGHSHITLNSKLGVDVLRNEVLTFCQNRTGDPFSEKKNNYKVVYLEEFDGATKALQEELRAFIETFEQHNVRFIATCNNISKITDAMQSRFTVIDFSPLTQEENKNMKVQFAMRLVALIKAEQLNVTEQQVKDIVKSAFPDLRKCMNKLQIVHLTGTLDRTEVANTDNQIYEIISSNATPEQIWNYMYQNWLDRLDSAFAKFGREYWKYIETNKPDELHKMPSRMIKISEYLDSRLPNARDPFVTLCAMVFDLQQSDK